MQTCHVAGDFGEALERFDRHQKAAGSEALANGNERLLALPRLGIVQHKGARSFRPRHLLIPVWRKFHSIA